MISLTQLHSEPGVQVCDARNDAQGTEAGNIKNKGRIVFRPLVMRLLKALLRNPYHPRSMIRMIFAIIHGIGAYRSHFIITG